MIVLKNPEQLKKDILSVCTITACAERIKYSKAYISSIISGVRNPNPIVAIKLCELTGKQFENYFFIRNVNK